MLCESAAITRALCVTHRRCRRIACFFDHSAILLHTVTPSSRVFSMRLMSLRAGARRRLLLAPADAGKEVVSGRRRKVRSGAPAL